MIHRHRFKMTSDVKNGKKIWQIWLGSLSEVLRQLLNKKDKDIDELSAHI